LIDEGQRAVPAHVLAYHPETGFALVQALGPLGLEPIPLGCSAELVVGDPVVVAGAGDADNAVAAEVIAKHEFAGYWEYVLDEAIFTAPAHPNWGGTALLGVDGRLYGIGSLGVQTTTGASESQSANMMVPIDLLVPILGELRTHGHTRKPARPWLGWFVQDQESTLTVIGLYDQGPAVDAGLQAGDLILEIAGQPVRGLAHLFRTIWSLGPAGVAVPVTYLRDRQTHTAEITSVDRTALARSGPVH
jgi:S1-C subfamily serine protease